MRVVFEDVVHTYDKLDCVETSKIDHLDAQTGKIHYRKKCKVAGKRVMRRTTDPVELSRQEAKKLRPGHYLTAMADASGRAVVVDVFASDKRDKRVQLRGVYRGN